MDELEPIKAQLAELLAWKKEREAQALPYPIDDVSRAQLQSVVVEGTSGTGTSLVLNLSGNAEAISVPASITGFVTLTIGGVRYKLAYYT